MAFSDSSFRGAMLVLLDGSDPTHAPLRTCSTCKRPMLRVYVTAGARAVKPDLAKHADACITKKWRVGLPCPAALASVKIIDDLMDAARA